MINILVVGETCKDEFVYCQAKRLAPDVPVPVLEISKTKETPGMAMNVQRNVLQLIEQCHLVTNDDWQKIVKTRYIHETTNHMFFRIDTPHIIQRIDFSKLHFNYDAIVISDYNKGFLSEEDIAKISEKHKFVFLDTKKIVGDWAAKCKFIKINEYEYKRSEQFLNPHLKSKIIQTLGGRGCSFNGTLYPVQEVEVKDSSGAGDAFFAAFVVKFLQTQDTEQSIRFANKCASQVVTERGVSLICQE